MKKILYDISIVLIIVTTIVFVYRTYGDKIISSVFGSPNETMFVESVPLSVSVALTPAEQKQGLSGVKQLGRSGGKFFVFKEDGYYGMWMKDMLIPLDILWINNDLEIVHIEANISPDTYPDSFVSSVPARYVLEVNSFFAENNNITLGDKITLPPSAISKNPADLLQ